MSQTIESAVPTNKLIQCQCLEAVTPSGRGYNYDRSGTKARGDVGADARRLASLSHQAEANCGFTIKYAYYGDPPANIRAVEFAEGYNSVSVPVIEKRLEVNISEAIERCVKKAD